MNVTNSFVFIMLLIVMLRIHAAHTYGDNIKESVASGLAHSVLPFVIASCVIQSLSMLSMSRFG